MDFIIRLAQLERENISEATKQRLNALRALGKTLGRPKEARIRNNVKRVDTMLDGISKRVRNDKEIYIFVA